MLPVLTGGTNRTTVKPTRIGPVTVPAGTMVWIPFSALFNSPHNWEAPDVYNPVRTCRWPQHASLAPSIVTGSSQNLLSHLDAFKE